MEIEWAGVVFAATTVATIAIGHHLVRRLNYHFGRKPAVPFFIVGVGVFASSFWASSAVISGVLGIVGLTTVVDGLEVLKQEKRIARGHAPMNPQRPVSPADTTK